MARSVVIDVIGTDDASGTFNKVADTAESSSGRMSKAFGSAIETAKSLGIALGTIEIAKQAIDVTKQAISFQADMKLIQTQAGASSQEVANMTTAVEKLSGPVATAPTALATALYAVESAGERGAVALNTLTIAAEGAKVGHADLTQTADALVAAIQSGIPGTENAQKAMGALNATVGAGKMTLDDLNAALSTGILPAVKGFGLSINDVGAALADFGDQGITGANAATSLRMAVQALAKPAAGGAATLKSLGLSTTQLGKDLSKGGLSAALDDLQTHLEKSGVKADQMGQVLTEAFGKKAGVGLQVLEGNMTLYDQKVKQVQDGANGFGAAWAATTKNASFAIDQLKTSFETAGISLATKLLPYADTAATWLAAKLPVGVAMASAALAQLKPDIVDIGTFIWQLAQATLPLLIAGWQNISKAWSASVVVLGVVSRTLADVGGFIASHETLVRSLAVAVLAGVVAFKLWTGAIAAWKAITEAATAVQAAFDAVMDANPIMLVVIAIAALAAGFAYAYTHSKTFRDIVNDVGNALKTVWTDVLEPVVDFFENHWKAALEIAGAVLLPFVALPVIIYANWGKIVDFFDGIGSDIAGAFTKMVGAVVSVVKGSATAVLKAFIWVQEIPAKIYEYVVSQGGLLGIGMKIMTAFVNGVTAGASALWTWLKSLPATIVGLLADAATWLVGVGEDMIQGWLNGNIAAAKLVWDWLKALPGEVVTLLGDAGSWLYNAGVAVVTGWWNGLVAEYRIAKAWFLDIPADIEGALHDAATWLVSTGENIIEGIITGIENKVGSLGSSLINGVKSAIGGLGKFLGIASPSKYMRDQIGQWIPAGIAQGIDGNAKIVTTAMTSVISNATRLGAVGSGLPLMDTGAAGGGSASLLSSSLSGVAAPAGAVSSRGGDTYNIYEQSDPVQTARTIARYQQRRAAV